MQHYDRNRHHAGHDVGNASINKLWPHDCWMVSPHIVLKLPCFYEPYSNLLLVCVCAC